MITDNRFFTVDNMKQDCDALLIPKVFMDPKSEYFNMDPMSKFLYGILASKVSKSIEVGLYDDTGRIYFTYSQADLCRISGIKTPSTVRKYLKELEKYNLLIRVRVGLNQPDRMYLFIPNSENLSNDNNDENTVKSTDSENKSNLSNRYNTNRSNRFINTSTDKQNFNADSDALRKIMKHCQSVCFKLRKIAAQRLLLTYSADEIIKSIDASIKSAKGRIQNFEAYLVTVLKQRAEQVKKAIKKATETVTQAKQQASEVIQEVIGAYKKQPVYAKCGGTMLKNRFNDFPQRDYSKQALNDMEYMLINRK